MRFLQGKAPRMATFYFLVGALLWAAGDPEEPSQGPIVYDLTAIDKLRQDMTSGKGTGPSLNGLIAQQRSNGTAVYYHEPAPTAFYQTVKQIADEVGAAILELQVRQAEAFLSAVLALDAVGEMEAYLAKVNDVAPADDDSRLAKYDHFKRFVDQVEEKFNSRDPKPVDAEAFYGFVSRVDRSDVDERGIPDAPIITEVMSILQIAPIYQREGRLKSAIRSAIGEVEEEIRSHGFPERLREEASPLITVDLSQVDIDEAPVAAKTWAVALTDFIVSRARQELIARLASELGGQLRGSDLAEFVPAMTFYLGRFGEFYAGELVSAFRSAAADDLRHFPSRIARQGVSTAGRSMEVLDRLHGILESIRNGTPPWVAFDKGHSTTFQDDPTGEATRQNSIGDNCYSRSLAILGTISREWRASNTPLMIESRADDLRVYVDMDSIMEHEIWREKYYDNLSKSDSLQVSNLSDSILVVLLDGAFIRFDKMKRHFYLANDSEVQTLTEPEVVLRSAVELIGFVASTVCGIDTGDQRDSSSLFETFMNAYLAAVDGRYTDIAANGFRLLEELERLGQTEKDSKDEQANKRRALQRLLVLGASLAEATSSEDLEKTLHLFADPVGSFVTKRESGLHITIGSYLGLTAGVEYLSEDEGYHLGIGLPIGVEFSHGIGDCCSFGLFASPVDLGVIASYRLDEGQDGDMPEIGWSQLVAPSVYLVFGFPRDYPLALAIGVQYAADLREHSAGIKSDAFRASFMIATDVTLFRF